MIDLGYYLCYGVLVFIGLLFVLLFAAILYGGITGEAENKKRDTFLAASPCPSCGVAYGKKAIKRAREARQQQRAEAQKRHPGMIFRYSLELDIICLNCGSIGSVDEDKPMVNPSSTEERSLQRANRHRWKTQRHAMLDLSGCHCHVCGLTYGPQAASAARRNYVTVYRNVLPEEDIHESRDKEWLIECPNCHRNGYFNYIFEVLHSLPRQQRTQPDSDTLEAFANWKSPAQNANT